MPLDHYIPQVHLRKFYSPALGERMYATRKSDLKSFTPNSNAVCGINNGSTNSYLRGARWIEEFLKGIEPNYDAALAKLMLGNIDREAIYVIAGFVAYVIGCSPTGMRINSEPLRSIAEILRSGDIELKVKSEVCAGNRHPKNPGKCCRIREFQVGNSAQSIRIESIFYQRFSRRGWGDKRLAAGQPGHTSRAECCGQNQA